LINDDDPNKGPLKSKMEWTFPWAI
jgi:hypothetical protein